MKYQRIILQFAVVFAIAAAAVASEAQTPLSKPLTPQKVAVVYSEVFADQKLGISKFQAVKKALDAEFKQTRDELMRIQSQMTALEKQIRESPAVADPGSIADKAEQFERLKREFGFRSNEANIAFEKRYEQLAKPINEEISRALAEFARKAGADILIDASKNNGVYVLSSAADLTSEFVAYFNAQPSKP